MPTNDTPGAGAKADGGGVMNTIQQQAGSALSSQKTRAADSMTAVIEAIRQTGGQLREKNATLAGYADSAAGQLERWSTQLRDRDLSELMDDVSSFARRRPAVFIGSGLAIGLVAARFLKSSAPNSSSSRGMGQQTQRFATSPSMGSPRASSFGSTGSQPMSSGSMSSGSMGSGSMGSGSLGSGSMGSGSMGSGSGSMGSGSVASGSGSMGSGSTGSGSMGSGSTGSMDTGSTMPDSSSSGIAADRSGSRSPKTPRTRTKADER